MTPRETLSADLAAAKDAYIAAARNAAYAAAAYHAARKAAYAKYDAAKAAP